MPRPRTHDVDELLDVAEQIVTETGTAGLTLRNLAAAAGVSNGSIYHAFSSKEELLARVWLRTAQRFLQRQAEAVDAVLAHADPDVDVDIDIDRAAGIEAVVQAALTPVGLARQYPAAARLFFMQRRDQLFSPQLSPSTVTELESVQTRFTALLIRLADAVWRRHDARAVDTIAACVVDLAGGLMRRQLLSGQGVDEHTGTRIAAATRAILALPLPEAPARRARTSRPKRKER
ncbi:MAG TPA: helix-turn-helix domain-containing protein [Jatrophihabitantaceae bacterium]